MEDRFMRNSLIAAALFGGFLAETAQPVIAAPQMKNKTPAPQTQKKQIQKSSRSRGGSRRRNVARGAVGGAAGGAILGGGRGAAGGAVLGGTAGSLSRRGRRR